MTALTIDIINEFAEECENDVCGWKYIDSTSYDATIPCRGKYDEY